MKRLLQIFILLFICLMLRLWFVITFQSDISIDVTKIIGINNPKSDLGGLYLGISLLLLFYFIKSTEYLKGVIILTSAVVLNSIIGLIRDGFSLEILGEISIEIIVITVCYLVLIKFPTLKDYSDEIHPDFKVFSFMKFGFKPAWRKRVINSMLEKKYAAASTYPEIKITDYTITGYENRPIKVEVFEDKDAPDDSPCIIAYPGGAFWAKPIPTYKYLFGRYIQGTKAKVVFVHFTLSIHSPYPASAEDCYLASVWAYENAAMLGFDKNRIALYGSSTGGTLAAAVSQMLRDRGQFKPCFQLLIYPLLDGLIQTVSAVKYRGMIGWKEGIMEDGIRIYMKGHEIVEEEVPAYASPNRATDFSNLPNAYMEIAEYDCLRDEGEIYAEKLINAGAEVEIHEVRGAVHGFDIVLKSDITRAFIQKRIAALNRAFSRA